MVPTAILCLNGVGQLFLVLGFLDNRGPEPPSPMLTKVAANIIREKNFFLSFFGIPRIAEHAQKAARTACAWIYAHLKY
jgi:hypothetical protein